MYRSKQNNEFDKAELVLYEEVARMPPFQRKVLCLISCAGVGRRTLKNRIIETYPDKFGTTLPREYMTEVHTTQQAPLCHVSTQQRYTLYDIVYIQYTVAGCYGRSCRLLAAMSHRDQ